MTDFSLTLIILAIIMFSSTIRSAMGFGNALVAMPLLVLVISIKTASPLVVLITTTISIVLLLKTWRQIDVKSTWQLVISAIVGVPFGIYILKYAPENIVKGGLGILLILFSMYQLNFTYVVRQFHDRYAYIAGFLAGVLGGAYNTHGPPIIVYGTLKRWSPQVFLATLQSYSIPLSLTVLIGHALAGFWTTEVLRLYVLSLPVVGIATWFGIMLNKQFSTEQYQKIVYVFLIIMGIVLLI